MVNSTKFAKDSSPLALGDGLRDDTGDFFRRAEVLGEDVLGQCERGSGGGVGVGVAPPHAPYPGAAVGVDVEVHVKPDLLGVEGLRAIHVRSGNRNRFELPTHAVSPFLLVTVPSY